MVWIHRRRLRSLPTVRLKRAAKRVTEAGQSEQHQIDHAAMQGAKRAENRIKADEGKYSPGPRSLRSKKLVPVREAARPSRRAVFYLRGEILECGCAGFGHGMVLVA